MQSKIIFENKLVTKTKLESWDKAQR